ncbi:MAG: hypothetical protein M3069_04250 [Chloroflexota bacterium]|nr:hypothetical protein [Chloroflexota bacterium]
MSPLLAASDVDGDDGDGKEDDGDQLDAHDRAEELTTLLRWLRIDRFDRRALNRQLARLEMTRVRVVA